MLYTHASQVLSSLIVCFEKKFNAIFDRPITKVLKSFYNISIMWKNEIFFS